LSAREDPVMNMTRLSKLIGTFAASVAFAAAGQTMQTPMLDPWVPPTLRKAVPRQPAEGTALKAQVERKLRASFDAADVAGAGSLTREQASAAGLGFVVKNFDQIDATGAGRVTFDDLKRYLRAQGADL
jgi:hypothetical protein